MTFGLFHLLMLGVIWTIPYLILAGFHGLMPLQKTFEHLFERLFPFLTVRAEDYEKTNMQLHRALLICMGFIVGVVVDGVVQIMKLAIRSLKRNAN